ncbi:glycoside hydrolase family 88 protein [Alicyclobacillus sp. SP_1]|uniref:glycoside hydrolase family 88 protein n=1 Tax=Alicyclobacillus sp. SP_1 TaxID=2942475 RepID=UPI002156FE8F|nr:glycoside hydrolase family 88 protein [Alicyclobacillus sp. SP_1]
MERAGENDWVTLALDHANGKIERLLQRISSQFPHAVVRGEYVLAEPSWWTGGFWPGLLWLGYRYLGLDAYRQIAERCEADLVGVLRADARVDHDAGFLFTLSSVQQYRLASDHEAALHALTAAERLASRFNLRGRFLRAWGNTEESRQMAGWAIIDCLMNLPLLHFASNFTGDPRFSHIANAHADTVLAEFLHPHGWTAHIVAFHPETGQRLGRLSGQGAREDSAWSRGAAWALCGLAHQFRHTGDERYARASRRLADFFDASWTAGGVDCMPPWDFDHRGVASDAFDSSAAAIAACGLLVLGDAMSDGSLLARGREWVQRLWHHVQWHEQEVGGREGADNFSEGIVPNASANVPENLHVNTSLIYGDYFYVEALMRLRGTMEPEIW